jgi:hypothetical protein
MAEFHSVNEAKKPKDEQVYHNSECGPAKEIPKHERKPGTGGYRLCKDCQK